MSLDQTGWRKSRGMAQRNGFTHGHLQGPFLYNDGFCMVSVMIFSILNSSVRSFRIRVASSTPVASCCFATDPFSPRPTRRSRRSPLHSEESKSFLEVRRVVKRSLGAIAEREIGRDIGLVAGTCRTIGLVVGRRSFSDCVGKQVRG